MDDSSVCEEDVPLRKSSLLYHNHRRLGRGGERSLVKTYNISMSKKKIKVIAIALFTIASLLYGLMERFGPGDVGAQRDFVTVEKVYDGDTVGAVVGKHFQKIRLIGIDAPEMGQRPWGRRAKRHIEKLIDRASWRVRIEYDVETRDQYGRILAYLWTVRGKMINNEMVRDGYALLYTFPPNVKHVAELRAAQKLARSEGRGIWSPNGLKELPSEYRRQHRRRRPFF
jgi:micrococcal nuclease